MLSFKMTTGFPISMKSIVQNRIDELAVCKCCVEGTGHNLNKPVKWEPWVETTPHFTQNPACKCSCRHEARVLCRMHPDCKTEHALVPEMQCYGHEMLRKLNDERRVKEQLIVKRQRSDDGITKVQTWSAADYSIKGGGLGRCTHVGQCSCGY